MMSIHSDKHPNLVTWYWKPSQLLGASEIMNLREESATTRLLDQIIPYYIQIHILIPTDKCNYGGGKNQ